MASRADGNASKRVAVVEPGPWVGWRDKARARRAIRFIETYCRAPKGFGAGKPIKLAPFQKAWLRQVLAPKVTSAAMEVARGNGKSTFLAAVALWALFDEEADQAPQIPIVATTVNQAIRSVYGVALDMIAAEPVLANRSLVYSAIGNMRVKVPYNRGELFPVSNEPDGLQGLDPSLAVCDEIGFMPVDSWGSLLLASGKRPRSLVVGIGTPGFDKESALWHLRERHRSGEELPGFLFTEYAADEGCDIRDERQWRKANPALAQGYMAIEALRTAVAISPESHFRIFRLGQWVDGVDCWLGVDAMNVWRRLVSPWDGELGGEAWVGVDLGLKHDSTAITWVQRRPDGRLHVKAKIWLPRPDGKLDVSDAMQFIRELGGLYQVREVVYDPRFFELPAQTLADEGFPMVEMPQVLERMSQAVGATYEAIMRNELTHDGDVAFETQVLNAVARNNERGFILSKSKSRNRIDAAVSMCMAVHRAYRRVEANEPWVAYA